MMEKEYDILFKLLLIGDSCVGKSCILLKFADDCFSSSFITTVGVDFKIRTVNVEGTKIKLQIWDSAGQERFRTIVTAFFRGAMGIILVYDITNEKSFDNIKTWIRSIQENTTAESDVEKMILGNKCDLAELRVISTERGRTLAEEYGVKFMETSARTGYNIENAFITLTKDIKHKLDSQRVDTVGESNSSSTSSGGGIKVAPVKIEGEERRTGGNRCCNNS